MYFRDDLQAQTQAQRGKVTGSRLSKLRNLESFKSDALNSDLNHESLPTGKTTKKEKLSLVTATKSGLSKC